MSTDPTPTGHDDSRDFYDFDALGPAGRDDFLMFDALTPDHIRPFTDAEWALFVGDLAAAAEHNAYELGAGRDLLSDEYHAVLDLRPEPQTPGSFGPRWGDTEVERAYADTAHDAYLAHQGHDHEYGDELDRLAAGYHAVLELRPVPEPEPEQEQERDLDDEEPER